MRLPWLADVLRGAGLRVVEVPGWQSRGRELRKVEGIICHHTATGPAASDSAIATMLRDGRPGLNGPLSQLGLARSGTFFVVAGGRANHNGYGTWGNDAIGIEAYNDGRGEPWAPVQLEAYKDGVAALLVRLGYGSDRVLAHRESDPARKVDPTGIDMDRFRRAIDARLGGGNDVGTLEGDQATWLQEIHAMLSEQKGLGRLVQNTHDDITDRLAKRPTEDEVREIVREAVAEALAGRGGR